MPGRAAVLAGLLAVACVTAAVDEGGLWCAGLGRIEVSRTTQRPDGTVTTEACKGAALSEPVAGALGGAVSAARSVLALVWPPLARAE